MIPHMKGIGRGYQMNIRLDGVERLLRRNFKFGDVGDKKTKSLLFAIGELFR